MPKQKTHRATKKRFKVTGTGKLLRRRAMRSHYLGKKSAKRKRHFGRAEEVKAPDKSAVERLLGR